jgi:hypothetical protein
MRHRRSVFRLAASAALAPFVATVTAGPSNQQWQAGEARLSPQQFGTRTHGAERPNVVLIVTENVLFEGLLVYKQHRPISARTESLSDEFRRPAFFVASRLHSYRTHLDPA